jgi:hypothetical protein
MKAAQFLLLVLGAASTSACAQYQFCHCINSGGSANDAATTAACNNVQGAIRQDPTNTFKECCGSPSNWLSNVHFKQYCWIAEAIGDSESCRDKSG